MSWIFVATAMMVSFGGQVKIVIQANDEASCLRLHHAVYQYLEGIRSNVILGDCIESSLELPSPVLAAWPELPSLEFGVQQP